MSWVDLVIILLLLIAVIRGTQVGVLQLTLSLGGFIAGLLAGAVLARKLAAHFTSPLLKLFFVFSVEIVLAIILASLGEIAANWLEQRAHQLKLGRLNKIFGAALALVLNLLIIWLLASALSSVNSYDLGRQIQHSFIVRQLDSALPNPPDALATLEKIISPNGSPSVFLGLEPQHTSVSPTNRVNNQAILLDEQSVVKIQGSGCGGLVFGSGFVGANNLVVTNAHVVAGIRHPQVVDSKKTYNAQTVWYDPNLDLAILLVKDLPDPPLIITSRTLPDNYAAAILGFPGGGSLVAIDGAIIDHLVAEGRNIYNQGVVLRNIYEIQGDIEPGNSGGPLLAPDGTVAGVIFARSISQNNVGYAFLSDQIISPLSQSLHKTTAVSTGECAPD